MYSTEMYVRTIKEVSVCQVAGKPAFTFVNVVKLLRTKYKKHPLNLVYCLGGLNQSLYHF